MTEFVAAHKAQTVTAQSFLDAAGVKFALAGRPGGRDVSGSPISASGSAPRCWSTGPWPTPAPTATPPKQLQKHFFRRLESAVPIRKDFEVTEDDLRTHDVIFVGRAETNSALAAWQDKIGFQLHWRTRSASPVRITLRKRKRWCSPPSIPWTRITWYW